MKVIFGFDAEGDFGVSINGEAHVFYKWHDATKIEQTTGFTELTDANAKNLWRKIRQAVEEFKEEEGIE